jgi:hypothetical protein
MLAAISSYHRRSEQRLLRVRALLPAAGLPEDNRRHIGWVLGLLPLEWLAIESFSMPWQGPHGPIQGALLDQDLASAATDSSQD